MFEGPGLPTFWLEVKAELKGGELRVDKTEGRFFFRRGLLNYM